MSVTIEQEERLDGALAPAGEVSLARQNAEAAEEIRVQRISRWGIPTDLVMKATETLPPEVRDAIRWVQRHGVNSGMSRAQLAERLLKDNGEPYDANTVYQVLTGRRNESGGSLEAFARAVQRLRRRLQESEAITAEGFIHTPITKAVWRVCQAALRKHRVAYVFGDSQIGKTTAVTEFARCHNHGTTILVRMPTGGALGKFQAELAGRMGLSQHRRTEDISRRIFDSFDESMLLVVDEAHQALTGPTGIQTLEWIRELHDRRRCGVVIVATEALRQSLASHRTLRQLWRRRSPGMVISLPAAVPQDILEQFAESFGLDPAPDRKLTVSYRDDFAHERKFTRNPLEVQQEVVGAEGLGAWCKLLEDARDLAEANDGRLGWGKVIIAYAIARSNEGVV
jgi:DNA transposition AAA+ family ATPase